MSRKVAKAVGEVLHEKYCEEYLNILKSFLDPKNYALENPEPHIPFDFTPDSGVYPEEDPECKIFDAVYELFTVLDNNGI